MAYPKRKSDEPRSLGSQRGQNHEAKRQALIDAAMAYVICAILNDIPAYVGTFGTTRGIRIKFYGDDPSQTYISTNDDLEMEMPEQVSDLVGKTITWEMLCRMAPQLAGAARELRKGSNRSEPAVPIPEGRQKPAQ